MKLIQIFIFVSRKAGAAVARAGLALLRFWWIPTLGGGDAADRRKRVTYHI
jgi:hypothetical protein